MRPKCGCVSGEGAALHVVKVWFEYDCNFSVCVGFCKHSKSVSFGFCQFLYAAKQLARVSGGGLCKSYVCMCTCSICCPTADCVWASASKQQTFTHNQQLHANQQLRARI